ncbi:MAG: DNA mismatch repair protein [Bacteroidetes bacterium]|nr:DNA mismatch repair protein [Bacteroidota bacterium]
MLLETDDQTMEDLGIFSRKSGGGIFDLYNHTHTRGGETLLREIFRVPLADKEAINRRSGVIECFTRLNTAFPFESADFDMAEKYLKNPGERAGNGSGKAVLNEKEVQQGVTAVIALIRQVRNFVNAAAARENAAYEPERREISQLISDPVFEPALRGKEKISFAGVTAFDILFRVRERAKIEQLLEHIYRLDVYLSVARVAAERRFVFPRAVDKARGILRLEGVYHPELKSPIANDLGMASLRNLIFLTGANMAGKSTFLRAVGTAVYLAHLGFPVAAAQMEFSVRDGLYTTINLPDNLGIGASHFYAEVLRVKKVATELGRGKSLFIIFDELFRGTNVKDAYEATVAVSRAFAGRRNSLFIISSHIVEAGEDLQENDGVGFHYLPTRMNGHVPEYTYTLEEGITDDRHGMIIIRNEGILETLRNGRKNGKAL